MKQLSKIEVGPGDDARSIELYEGDLTALSPEHAVDILVVSAFPNDYLETHDSLIGALNEKGVSIREFASNKELDLRSERSCWLSRPLGGRLGFDRILCFEPMPKASPAELIDDIFDSLDQILLGDFRDVSVAMPVVATGNMGWPITKMVPAILSAAVARLRIGLPLKQLMIVEYHATKAAAIQGLFRDFISEHGARIAARPRRHPKQRKLQQDATLAAPAAPPSRFPVISILPRVIVGKLGNLVQRGMQSIGLFPTLAAGSAVSIDRIPDGPASNGDADWDCFVSYSRKDEALVDKFIDLVRSQQPDTQIFRDSEALRIGGDWITALADAIDSSRRFVAIFSPDYFDSTWCMREFHAAIIRDDQGDDDLLYPIYLREDKTARTLYFTFNHVDCVEADLKKLKAAAERLIAQLA